MFIIINGLNVEMKVGIYKKEHEVKQPVVINLKASANIPYRPDNIKNCLDYTVITDYLKTWSEKPHTLLLETLLYDLAEFCFEDPRVTDLDIEILKTNIIPDVQSVGVGLKITREIFELKKQNE